MDLTDAIGHLGLTSQLPGLTGAIARSEDFIKRMRTRLAPHGTNDGLDVVAFGSLARREYTSASDVDYLVLVADMPEDPAAPRELLQQVKQGLTEEAHADGVSSKDPGTSGLFGKTVGIFDILNQVGLQEDTNWTHTYRMEILQESVSLFSNDLHSRILDSTIRRYLALSTVPPDRPPRFLINDMLRYWRQITVDYQAKAPTGGQEPKAVLRYLKLITTRKNLVASSILPLIVPREDDVSWEIYLKDIYSVPPLARLATVTSSGPSFVRDAVATVFRAIDLFVQRTDDDDKRQELAAIEWDARSSHPGYQELKKAANELQSAFETLLWDWEPVAQNTRRYLLL